MVTRDPRQKKQLSAAELQIMAALWACRAPATRHEIELKIAGGCAWADTTMVAFLERLRQKGYVEITRQANRNVYRPLVGREEFAAELLDKLRRLLFGGSLSAMVEALSRSGRVSLTDLDELQADMEGIIMDHPRYRYEYDEWERDN